MAGAKPILGFSKEVINIMSTHGYMGKALQGKAQQASSIMGIVKPTNTKTIGLLNVSDAKGFSDSGAAAALGLDARTGSRSFANGARKWIGSADISLAPTTASSGPTASNSEEIVKEVQRRIDTSQNQVDDGEYARAQEGFEEVIALGEQLMELGHPDAALWISRGYDRIAQVEIDAGNYEKAITACSSALKIIKTHPAAETADISQNKRITITTLRMANAMSLMGNSEDAITLIDGLTDLDLPDNLTQEVVYYKTDSLYNSGDYSKAVDVMQGYLEANFSRLQKNDPDLLTSACHLLEEALSCLVDNKRSKIAWYNKVLTLETNPTRLRAFLLLQRAKPSDYRELAESLPYITEALSIFEQLGEIDPETSLMAIEWNLLIDNGQSNGDNSLLLKAEELAAQLKTIKGSRLTSYQLGMLDMFQKTIDQEKLDREL
jgi:tetratricopeptide (TPR) repeat protein